MLIRFYTDGSYYDGFDVGAWAMIVCEPKCIKKYSGVCTSVTNNKMELKAVNEALSFSIIKKYKQIEILTDSSYIVNNIKNESYKEWSKQSWKTSKGKDIKNAKEWRMFMNNINELKKMKCEVKFTKVKSHSSNQFNNLADREAKLKIQKYLERRGIENG